MSSIQAMIRPCLKTNKQKKKDEKKDEKRKTNNNKTQFSFYEIREPKCYPFRAMTLNLWESNNPFMGVI